MAKIAGMRYLLIIIFFSIAFGLFACGNESNVPTDTIEEGKVDISVDETYKPIIEQQLRVFDSSFPNAHITAYYKPESQCIDDLLKNKARVALVTRELNAQELKYCKENSIVPTTLALVRDAVAVIINPASTDTNLSMEQLTGILTGQYNKKYTVVFDNEGSSTVRFVMDSVLKGQPLGKNVFAAKSNPAVVDYVANNPNAIGFIGMSYITNGDDSSESFLSKIRVVALKDEKSGNFYQPYQGAVAARYYPLSRKLYYINRETWQGLGSGFCNFMTLERGQLIFWYGRMVPLLMQIQVRSAELN